MDLRNKVCEQCSGPLLRRTCHRFCSQSCATKYQNAHRDYSKTHWKQPTVFAPDGNVFRMQRESDFERFIKRLEFAPNGCWLWRGVHYWNGYGSFFLYGDKRLVHRVSYETFVGRILEGLHCDHLCRVRDCVNPDHLEAVTHRENLMRGRTIIAFNAQKTHCPKGHPYDEENTYVRPNGKGRDCKLCRHLTQQARKSA